MWTGATPIALAVNSQAFGISASGQVVGHISTGSGIQPVVWTGTAPANLSGLDPINYPDYPGEAWGINASGQAAGGSPASNGYFHAVRWTGTTPTDLGTLGNGLTSVGVAINASGQVAGRSQTTPSSGYHAVRWTGTTPLDLGTLGGLTSAGHGINDQGDVVGMSDTATGSAPFLYTGGTMFNLYSLLVPGSGVSNLSVSYETINNFGQIAATGTINGVQQAILLTPTPEPSTLALFGIGLALLSRRQRESRKATRQG